MAMPSRENHFGRSESLDILRARALSYFLFTSVALRLAYPSIRVQAKRESKLLSQPAESVASGRERNVADSAYFRMYTSRSRFRREIARPDGLLRGVSFSPSRGKGARNGRGRRAARNARARSRAPRRRVSPCPAERGEIVVGVDRREGSLREKGEPLRAPV